MSKHYENVLSDSAFIRLQVQSIKTLSFFLMNIPLYQLLSEMKSFSGTRNTLSFQLKWVHSLIRMTLVYVTQSTNICRPASKNITITIKANIRQQMQQMSWICFLMAYCWFCFWLMRACWPLHIRIYCQETKMKRLDYNSN